MFWRRNSIKKVFVAALGILCLWQKAIAADRTPSNALTRPAGVSAALNGGGTSHVSDISAIDSNPAGIAQIKDVYLSGEFFWHEGMGQAVEAGVVDSVMSEIATGLKGRQTTKNSGGVDRRFTLGLAGSPTADFPLLVGLAGDFQQIENIDLMKATKSKKDNVTVRFGGIYTATDSILLGVRSQGYFDKHSDLEHAAALSLAFLNYYVFNGDLVFANEDPRKAIFGLTVMAKEFLDLHLSYGYEIRSRDHSGAGGVVVKSSKIRLMYTIAKPSFSNQLLEHSVALRLAFAM